MQVVARTSPVVYSLEALLLREVPLPERHLLSPLVIHASKTIHTAVRVSQIRLLTPLPARAEAH